MTKEADCDTIKSGVYVRKSHLDRVSGISWSCCKVADQVVERVVIEMKIEWKSCFRIGLTAFLLILCVVLMPKVGSLLLGVLSAATPLLIGCVIAYLVNVLMELYESIYFPKAKNTFLVKSRRPVCLVLAFVSLAVVVALVIALVIPELISCIMLLLELIPDAVSAGIAALDDRNMVSEEIIEYLLSIDWQTKISQLIGVITSGIGDVLDIVVGTVTSIFSGLVTALIAVIFSIYLLSGKERIAGQCAKLMKRYVQPRIGDKIRRVLLVMNECFRRYIVGQCTEAVILGVLCAVGMWAFGFPYATMIGALVAFTALIPIAGAYIGAFVGAFMILTVDPLKALLFLVYIVVLQQLEEILIYPRVVGSTVGLPGIWVLAAVTIGGGLMGVVGMLIGVPLAATVYRLLREDVHRCPPKNTHHLSA